MPTSSPFLLPYQRRWIEDGAPIKLMEKSRQIGMSWASAYSLVRETGLPTTRHDAWVSSRDAVQARLFLEDCAAFAGVIGKAAQAHGRQLLDGDAQRSTLTFANGRRIHSLSSNPDAQAGKRGPRILDEFALHPDPQRLYAIAWPGVTWGGQLAIISTHRGKHNFFNTLVREIREGGNPKQISLHRVTLLDALRDGFLDRLKVKLPPEDPRQKMDDDTYCDYVRSRCPDEESWQQEYLCQPADDATAFLPYPDLVACEYPEPPVRPQNEAPSAAMDSEEPAWLATPTPLPDGGRRRFYLGVDVGRVHDRTVFWVLETVGDVFYTRRVVVGENMTFDEQEDILDTFLRHPQMQRAAIDASGIGRQFAERAQVRFGRYKVEAITLSAAAKETLAYPLRSALEARRLRIPATTEVRRDLRAVRREYTETGGIRFAAERGPEGHSDRFWALALALHAAQPPLHAEAHYEEISRF